MCGNKFKAVPKSKRVSEMYKVLIASYIHGQIPP